MVLVTFRIAAAAVYGCCVVLSSLQIQGIDSVLLLVFPFIYYYFYMESEAEGG